MNLRHLNQNRQSPCLFHVAEFSTENPTLPRDLGTEEYLK